MTTLSSIRESDVFSKNGARKSALSHQGTQEPIAGSTIHIWSAGYSTLDRIYPYLAALISQDEMKKAAGFKKVCDSKRYILRHGLVRAVLAHYTHENPQEIRFVQGQNGKPDLDRGGKFPEIRFSLSSTDERVCLGITHGSDIGLDIARIQSRDSFWAIGQYLFTPKERLWITQGAPDKRPHRFIRIWSLKEALLKATGSDIHMMKEADVSGIMTDTYLHGCYPSLVGRRDQLFCIHESGCGTGHHRVIVTIVKE